MKKYQLQAIHSLLMEVSKVLAEDIAKATIAGDYARMGKYGRMLQNTIGGAEVIQRELDERKADNEA